jgi:hypothetical protein
VLSSNPETGPASSGFTVQTGVWYLRPALESVSTFVGGMLEFRSIGGASPQGDMAVVAQAGAEYAVAPRFAVGSSIGLAFRTGDSSAGGRPGSSFATTRVALFLTWWFT